MKMDIIPNMQNVNDWVAKLCLLEQVRDQNGDASNAKPIPSTLIISLFAFR